jgi:hypothetical protein
MLHTNDFFQEQAKQCREFAAQDSKNTDRDFWLRLAKRRERLLQPNSVGIEPGFERPIFRKKPFAKRFAKRRAA